MLIMTNREQVEHQKEMAVWSAICVHLQWRKRTAMEFAETWGKVIEDNSLLNHGVGGQIN